MSKEERIPRKKKEERIPRKKKEERTMIYYDEEAERK
jgi:hypothetical protein